MTRQANTGDLVTVHYTGKLEDGTVFDSSREGEPLEFKLGSGAVIPGFDHAVEGMEVGQGREIKIAPEDAYGVRREEMQLEVPRAQLPEEVEPAEGEMLGVQVAPGQQAVARIAKVADDTVTLDLNHPLAGQTLVFDIELVGLK